MVAGNALRSIVARIADTQNLAVSRETRLANYNNLHIPFDNRLGQAKCVTQQHVEIGVLLIAPTAMNVTANVLFPPLLVSKSV